VVLLLHCTKTKVVTKRKEVEYIKSSVSEWLAHETFACICMKLTAKTLGNFCRSAPETVRDRAASFSTNCCFSDVRAEVRDCSSANLCCSCCLNNDTCCEF